MTAKIQFLSGILISASLVQQVAAEPDELKPLLDASDCSKRQEISNLAQERLRRANSKGETIDLHLIEQSFVLVEFCSKDLESRLKRWSTSGYSDGIDAARQTSLILAAVVAYYRQGLTSQQSAPSLSTWHYLAKAADVAKDQLSMIIDRKFGAGQFVRYIEISNKTESSRSDAERKLYTDMHSWMEPL